jgi:hypothetical protein
MNFWCDEGLTALDLKGMVNELAEEQTRGEHAQNGISIRI